MGIPRQRRAGAGRGRRFGAQNTVVSFGRAPCPIQREGKRPDLANLIESTTDAFFVKDRDLHMVLCNSVLASMVGKQPVELYGKSDLESGWDSGPGQG